MAHDFIPRRDMAFREWSANFSAVINAAPEAFGLSAAQAADYAALHDAYAAALTIACEPRTRTSVSISVKKSARHNAEREARRLARLIQATNGISNVQRAQLGLTVPDTKPTPVAPPKQPPSLFVKLRFGSTIRVMLREQGTSRRGKPEGVAGAIVLSYVGDTPPGDFSKWTLAANTTRPNADVTIAGDIEPGAKVWITAYWYNARAQAGPAARPEYTYIQCPTLWFEKSNLRLAA